MSQNSTKCHINSNSEIVVLPEEASELSVEQHRAIQLLLASKTATEVASMLNKDRKTIHRWRQNPHFISEYNRQQSELINRVKTRLQNLTEKAVDVLEQHLSEGNLKAAIELFKVVNLYGNVPYSVTQTDPEMIVKAQAEEVAINEMCKEPFSEMRKANNFTRQLANDIAHIFKEKYDVKENIHDIISENIE